MNITTAASILRRPASTLLLALFLAIGCGRAIPPGEHIAPMPSVHSTPTSTAAAQPGLRTLEEIGDRVFYEVYVRNFSDEGTFEAVRQRLPELRDLGVTTLWIMPIHPIGVEARKGLDGSPYAIRDYHAIDPALGTGEDFRRLVASAHDLGLEVLLDCVMNHMAPDSVWAQQHPDWFLRDADGKPVAEYPDWTDIVDLDWENPAVWDAASEVMQFWVREYNIDGYRADVADLIPAAWWTRVRGELEAIKPGLLMFAESQEGRHYNNGFDIIHYEGVRDLALEVVAGKQPASVLARDWTDRAARYPRGSAQLVFTENHDKPRAMRTFGGAPQARAAAVLVTTQPGIPLLYTGTEVGADDGRDEVFFARTPVDFSKDPHHMRAFWKALLGFRASHRALQAGEMRLLQVEPADKVFAYERRLKGDRVMVVVNLSGEAVEAQLGSTVYTLEPWGWRLLANRPPAELGSRELTETHSGVVRQGNARFTFHSSALVRMEWESSGAFEDRASLMVTDRTPRAAGLSVRREGARVVVTTADLELAFEDDGQPFSADNLSIRLLARETPGTWVPGTPDRGNLGGTVRTLDGVNGVTPLDPGLISRDGWVLINDSTTPLFDPADPVRPVSRAEATGLDWYFLGHGHDYTRALRDFTSIAGEIPLPPRYLFGAWWSRYWDYSADQFKELIAEYREHEVPLDVLVVDMDWHLVGEQYPEGGWTGYSWNRDLFPDPAGFLKWARGEGLRVTLNLHPHGGVAAHEDAFPEFAKAMGVDPATTPHIPFDCTNPTFVDAYFRLLHHPMERDGVDFWWLDWQQQKTTAIAGLDPLFWLNYLHWQDMAQNPDRGDLRPLIFSRWGGLGNHRYQIGFSGDTHSTWDSVAFQPRFTATASNVGYGFWSHDVGGHFPGTVEPEIYARWIQMAAVMPFLRTHATRHPMAERRVWAFPEEFFHAMREAIRFRYHLLPYTYTAARTAHDTAVSLCRPLYYEWPEIDEAYTVDGQYLFGSDILAAPVTAPRDAVSRTVAHTVWFPPGTWIDWHTGEAITGPAHRTFQVPLDRLPLFARAGAVIPAAPFMRSSAERPLDHVILHAFPGQDRLSSLYEDDGLTEGYRADQFARTVYHLQSGEKRHALEIRPAVGTFAGFVEQRSHEVRFHGSWLPATVMADGLPLSPVASDSADSGWFIDPADLSVVVRIPAASVRRGRTVELVRGEGGRDDLSQLARRLQLVRAAAGILGEGTPTKLAQVVAAGEALGRDPAALEELALLLGDDHWFALSRAVGDSGQEPARVLEATARLLGLSAAWSVEGTGDPATPARATVKLALAEQAPGLRAAASLSVPVGWSTASPAVQDLGAITAGSPVTVQWDLAPAKGLQQATLAAELQLTMGGQEFRVPLAQQIFPSINDWMIIGPFDNPWANGLDVAFPPENAVDFAAEYPGKDGRQAQWRRITRTLGEGDRLDREFAVDLHEATGGFTEYAVAYAHTVVHSPADMEAVLAIGSDDGAAAWLNGEQVWKNHAGRPYTERQDRAPIQLKKGRNELLLKISQGQAGWMFGVHIETTDGAPVAGLTAGVE